MILYIFALIPAAIFDLKQGIVPNRLLIPAVIVEVVMKPNLKMLLVCFCLYFGFVFTQSIWKNYIGGADIKILISIFYLIQMQLLVVINFAALFALLYAKIKGQNRVRFVPFIVLGLLGTLACN